MSVTKRHIIYFGHNAKDAAVRRRAIAMQRAGFEVTGIMPRRGSPAAVPFTWIDLGQTHDNDYLQRIQSIFSGTDHTMTHRELLQSADLFVARNLDMLATALLVRKRLGAKTPVVYECLDVHHKLAGGSIPSRLLRLLEGRMVRACDLVVVSSPRFEEEHFRRYYKGKYQHLLVENRLIEGDAFGPRPQAFRPPKRGHLTLGWFGNLRCRRSLELLKSLARQFPNSLEIVLRGYPALPVIPDLEAEIADLPNMTYHGRYRAPEELGNIYGEVDAVWAGDWYEAGFNSVWLLPNRIYEGGYFGVPALAPAGTQTAQWLHDHHNGIIVPDRVEDHLPQIVSQLLDDPSPLIERRQAIAILPRDTYVEPPTLMQEMMDLATGYQDPGAPILPHRSLA